jgi:uncharacterized membrane protein
MNLSLLRQWALAFLAAVLLAGFIAAQPASAHKKKHHPPAQTEQPASPVAEPAKPAAAAGGPTAMHAEMSDMMEDMDEDRSNMSFVARLMDWLGRTHPVIVHFPIAFFPAALFTAIVGRRRPAYGAPVRFLVVAGGIIAPVAALFGWLDSANADPGSLLTVHRWLGTAIGIFALGLGIWAWRRPDQDRSAAMIAALAVITTAIVVQGWFGGAMVHGIDHMDW